MRQIGLALGIIITAGILGGCNVNFSSSETSEQPELVWLGNPAEVNGQPVQGLGIDLSVYRDPDSANGELRYELDTGCSGGGLVAEGGEVRSFEVLRPCEPEAMPVLGQIKMIAHEGAQFEMKAETVEIRSARGSVRFRRDDRVQTARKE